MHGVAHRVQAAALEVAFQLAGRGPRVGDPKHGMCNARVIAVAYFHDKSVPEPLQLGSQDVVAEEFPVGWGPGVVDEGPSGEPLRRSIQECFA